MARTVIVGSSVAGVRAARELRLAGWVEEIVVVGGEEVMPYDKPPLSKQLAVGTQTVDDIALLGADGWASLDVEGHLGTSASGLDVARRVLHTTAGSLGYDHLVVATGVRPRVLCEDDDVVFSVRQLGDGLRLRERLRADLPIVVIGGGFIGAEVASSARLLGAQVTLVESLETPFARALGRETGTYLAGIHRAAGVEVLTGRSVTGVTRTHDGAVVGLSDGRRLEAGLVVVGIGSRPNTEWLAGSGAEVRDGVLVDEEHRVPGVPGVYAIGDVARTPHGGSTERVEHWTSAVEQARVVARRIVDPGASPAAGHLPYFWSDQHGVKIQMVGRPGEADTVDLRHHVVADRQAAVAIYSREDRVVAGVTFGWPRAVATLRSSLSTPTTPTSAADRLDALAGRSAAPGLPLTSHR